MQRPEIPAEIRRAVLVQAGHRCAIPRCGATEIEIHHIVPWATCRKHEYSNLIALCLVCHHRADKGEIDRKALFQYKAALAASGGPGLHLDFDAPIVEIRRRIAEREPSTPGYVFEFDFPDFREARQRVVSKNLEAWGNELLAQFRQHQAAYMPVDTNGDAELEGFFSVPSRLKGSYNVVRNDDVVISVEYTLDRYFTGAAHGGQSTRVQNFLLSPFQPITLVDLLAEDSSLADLSVFIRERLLSSGKYDEDWVLTGTKPEEENFARFVLDNHGLRFIFEEYQIDCYAAGRQELWLGYDQLSSTWNQSLFAKLRRDAF